MTARVEELWLLGGVTASGKTQMALEWAEKNNAEILSCDSVSFYRGLDVGSAKPDSMDQRRVVHHGLDLAGVSEVFDVSKFHSYAEEAVEEIASRGKRVLVVGGSGFFLHGFLKPVVDGLDISDEVRQYVIKRHEEEGIAVIIEELKKLNPEGLLNLDLNNPVRVLRGLERCLQSGKPLRDLIEEFEKLPRPYASFQKRMIWLDRGDQELMDRINLRTIEMMENGMIEETKIAMNQGIEDHPSLSEAVGYREVIDYLKHGGEEKDLLHSIAKSTRRLVSKQRKWFRKHFAGGSRLHLDSQNKIQSEEIPWVAGT
jgi:tRNA dimethylallyltransferase